MGYTVAIGDLKHHEPEYDEDRHEFLYTTGAVYTTHVDAPNEAYLGRCNTRSPTYSVWSEVCNDLGLKGLLNNSPTSSKGFNAKEVIMIDEEFVKEFTILAELFRKNNPTIVPKYTDDTPDTTDTTDEEMKYMVLCGSMVRLVWLEFWIDWAVKNCKTPVMVTT